MADVSEWEMLWKEAHFELKTNEAINEVVGKIKIDISLFTYHEVCLWNQNGTVLRVDAAVGFSRKKKLSTEF